MFDTTQSTIKTCGYAVLVAALAGTALTSMADTASARGFGGGGFHFGGGGHGGGFHFGGGAPRSVARVRSFGGTRSFGGRSSGGRRLARSVQPKASFAKSHFAKSHFVGGHVGKPLGVMRTTVGGHFGAGPKLGTRLAMNPGGFRPGVVRSGFGKGGLGKGGLGKGGLGKGGLGKIGLGKGGHLRLPGRLALGTGLVVVGAGLGGEGPDYVPVVAPVPVYDPPVATVPVYTPVAGGPTIPTGPILPARLAQGPLPAPTPVATPAAVQPAGNFVNVAFQSAVTPNDLDTFVKAYNVTIVDGPSPEGVYRIQLSAEPMTDADLAAVVDSMRSQTAFVKDVTIA